MLGFRLLLLAEVSDCTPWSFTEKEAWVQNTLWICSSSGGSPGWNLSGGSLGWNLGLLLGCPTRWPCRFSVAIVGDCTMVRNPRVVAHYWNEGRQWFHLFQACDEVSEWRGHVDGGRDVRCGNSLITWSCLCDQRDSDPDPAEEQSRRRRRCSRMRTSHDDFWKVIDSTFL
jgi:hypothetical protein